MFLNVCMPLDFDCGQRLPEVNSKPNSSLILLATTQRTGVRQQAVALVSSHVINAGALVEAGVGGALVDVSLAVRPCVGGIREARVKHKLGAHTQNRRKANGGKVDAGR